MSRSVLFAARVSMVNYNNYSLLSLNVFTQRTKFLRVIIIKSVCQIQLYLLARMISPAIIYLINNNR